MYAVKLPPQTTAAPSHVERRLSSRRDGTRDLLKRTSESNDKEYWNTSSFFNTNLITGDDFGINLTKFRSQLAPFKARFTSVPAYMIEKAFYATSVILAASSPKNVAAEYTVDDTLSMSIQFKEKAAFLELFFDDSLPNGFDFVFTEISDEYKGFLSGDLNLILKACVALRND